MRESGPGEFDTLTWSDLRTHKLLDTAISGAGAGGILNSLRGGYTHPIFPIRPSILTLIARSRVTRNCAWNHNWCPGLRFLADGV